jgi:hypothetical protein
MSRFHRHAIDDPADSITKIITVEEYNRTLQQVDDHAWDGFGLGVPMQFVESIMALDSAEKCISRPRSRTHQPDERGEDRNDYPGEDPKSDHAYDGDEREGEFDAIDAPDLDQCSEIEQIDGG